MKLPSSDTEITHPVFQTSQYQLYKRAQKAHATFNTAESFALMEETMALILKTEDGKNFLQMIVQKKAPLDNVLARYVIMLSTPAFKQYEDAKIAHKQDNTADTQCIVNWCISDLRNTEECQNWLHVTEQEIHAPEKSYTERVDEFAKILKKNIEYTWVAATKTLEYQHYKKAIIDHEQSSISLPELKQYKHSARATNEYLDYCKAQEEKRMLLTKLYKYSAPITIDFNLPTCVFNYVEQKKTMKKLDNRMPNGLIPIITIQMINNTKDFQIKPEGNNNTIFPKGFTHA